MSDQTSGIMVHPWPAPLWANDYSQASKDYYSLLPLRADFKSDLQSTFFRNGWIRAECIRWFYNTGLISKKDFDLMFSKPTWNYPPEMIGVISGQTDNVVSFRYNSDIPKYGGLRIVVNPLPPVNLSADFNDLNQMVTSNVYYPIHIYQSVNLTDKLVTINVVHEI